MYKGGRTSGRQIVRNWSFFYAILYVQYNGVRFGRDAYEIFNKPEGKFHNGDGREIRWGFPRVKICGGWFFVGLFWFRKKDDWNWFFSVIVKFLGNFRLFFLWMDFLYRPIKKYFWIILWFFHPVFWIFFPYFIKNTYIPISYALMRIHRKRNIFQRKFSLLFRIFIQKRNEQLFHKSLYFFNQIFLQILKNVISQTQRLSPLL